MQVPSSKVEHEFSAEITSSASANSRLAGSGWLKFFWPVFAVLLFIICTVFAITQPPRSDPWQPVDKWSTDWFLNPVDTNAFKRLPIVLGDLSDIFALPDGDDVWAVGDDGLILHSSDGGKNWEQQNPQKPSNAAKKAEELIPSAYAMDVGGHTVQAQQVSSIANTQQKLSPKEQYLFNKKLDKRKKALVDKKLKARNPPASTANKVLQNKIGSSSTVLPSNPYTSNLRSVYFIDVQRGWVVGDGGTILSTSNGGKTWDKQSSGSDAALRSIQMQMQTDALHGWVVGSDGTILVTSNGGKTWDKQSSGTGALLNSIQMQTDGSHGWVVGGGGIILSTSNGGKTWDKQSSGTGALLNSIRMQADGQRGWVVGGGGTILFSSDGGKTWDKQSSGTGVLLNSIQMQADGQHGWVVGDGGTILTTRDYGKTWDKQSSGFIALLQSIQMQADSQRGWVVGGGGTILSTSDGGKTWDKQSSGSAAAVFSIQMQADSQRGWVVGGDGTILSTSDGGKIWDKQISGSDAVLISIQIQADGQLGWVVGSDGTILSTRNGGKTWYKQNSGSDAAFSSIQMQADGQRGWVVGGGGAILVTSDGGETWDKRTNGSDALLNSIQMQADGQRGWVVGGSGTILVTRNGGKTWDKQSSGSDALLNSIQMQADGQRGWVVGGGGTILVTSNGGKTWHKQTSDSDVALISIQMLADGQRGWVVGGSGTILSTSNGGKTWDKQSSGSDALLNSIQMQADGQRGWVVGKGRTILATNDGGKTWQNELVDYSNAPAPWYYLIAALCLLLLGFTSGRLIRKELSAGEQEGSKESIINKSVSDKPAGPGSPDYLGALKVARGLARFISNRNTTPPVTMAITGDWGSGKSSVMNYLCAQLKRDGLKPVWFNAWHHREEGNVLASMLENVRRQAIPKTPYGLYVRARLLLKRHWIFKLASVALVFGLVYIILVVTFADTSKREDIWHYALYSIGVEQPVALSKKSIETFCKSDSDAAKDCNQRLSEMIWIPPKNSFSSNSQMLKKMKQLLGTELSNEQESDALQAAVHPISKLPFSISSTLASVIGTLFGLIALLIVKGASIVGVGTTGIIQSMISMAGFKRSKEPVGTRQLFERQFRQITELLGNRRLVIFIDDLDRCETDYTMKVLETTNFLASCGELFMVIGMAPRYVLANVNMHFSELAKAVHEVEMDNNNASLDADAASPSKASFAHRYLQKLINIEVPVPKGDKDSTRNMLLGKLGEEDSEGKLEIQRQRILRQIWKYVWFSVVIGVSVLAWQLASNQKIGNFQNVSIQPQQQNNLEQSSTKGKTGLDDSRQRIEKRIQAGQKKKTESQARLIPGDPIQRHSVSIVVPSLVMGITLLVLLLAWYYRNNRQKLMTLLKPMGIAIRGPTQTEDSEGFSKALNIWTDVIFKANPNPRKIKVFLNHLRYISSQMLDVGGGNEAHLVGIAVMHYAFGKDIKSPDGKNLLATDVYSGLCGPQLADLIRKSWTQHKAAFDALPSKDHWDAYFKFIDDVEIHQPHHHAQ